MANALNSDALYAIAAALVLDAVIICMWIYG